MLDRIGKAAGLVAATLAAASAIVGLVVWLAGRASAQDLHALDHRVTVGETFHQDEAQTLKKLDDKTDGIRDDVSRIRGMLEEMRRR